MAINKVVFGDRTLMDVSGDTVNPSALAEGYTAHDANGELIQGDYHASYSELPDKPSINGNTVEGKMTGADLGLVDAEVGKGLSTNDYTDEDKAKLATVKSNAQENVIENITLNGTYIAPVDKTVALTVITETVDNLTNYYKKNETYTQAEVNNLVSTAAFGGFEVVSELPTTDISAQKIYLLPKAFAGAANVYDEYINPTATVEGWEKIGDTEMDLSSYIKEDDAITKEELDAMWG